VLAFCLSLSLHQFLGLYLAHLKLLLVLYKLFLKLLDLKAKVLLLVFVLLPHLLIAENCFLHLSPVFVLVRIAHTQRLIAILEALNLDTLLF
jgi:hypothetical protein